MRRLIPRTIAGRVAAVLVLGLTVSHLLSLAVYYGDGRTVLAVLDGGHIAERIATVARLVEASPPGRRAAIIAAVQRPGFRVFADATPVRDAAPSWRTRLMARVLAEHMPEIARDRFVVAEHPGGGGAPVLRLVVRLSGGGWLGFEVPAFERARLLSLRFFLSLTVMAAAIVVLSLWAVGRVTRPLAAFARAAHRLGRDVRAPPLAAVGPVEVRHAARAFNEMQARIRRAIDDRVRMLAAVSHDLRTPITRLRLRAEFVEDAEQRAKMLADLEEMEAMIASFLAFARADADAEPSEPRDLAALLAGLCRDLAEAGAEVAFAGPDAPVPIPCRPLALRRALTNVIENAVTFGTRARVSVLATARAAVVRIDDDGPGIPPEDAEAVFAPFYRREGSRSRDGGGVGLGLAIARAAVRAHGGEVVLRNRAEGGLRVEVTLPRQLPGGPE